jgi:hypothetical protein
MLEEADLALKMMCDEKNRKEKERERDRSSFSSRGRVSPHIGIDLLSQLSQLNDGISPTVPAAGDWDSTRAEGGVGGENVDWSNARDDAVGGGGDREWGDTGSLLTHGSSVVLAGNMAAAMRQRKRQTNYKRDDGEDGSTAPSTGTNSTAVNSRSSSVTDRGADRDRDRGEESAAAVLDLAIGAEKRLSQNARILRLNLPSTGAATTTQCIDKKFYDLERAVCGMGIAFLGEGDVTHNEADRGESIMHWDALENAGGGSLRGSASLFLSVDDDGETGECVSKPCTPPRPASRGGPCVSGMDASFLTLGKDLDMRENWGKQNVESTFNSLRDSGLSSVRGSGAGSALNSARGSGAGSALTSVRGSRDYGDPSPRMELREGRSDSLENHCRDSPRQQNDHRPVSSTTSRGDSLNNMTRAPSASFKIAVDGQDLAGLKPRVPARKSDTWSRGRGAVFGDLSGAFEKDSTGLIEGVSGEIGVGAGGAGRGIGGGAGRRVYVEADEDVSTDSEVTDRRLGKGKGSEGVIAPRSIVHRDLVQRHFSPITSPSASPSPSPSYSEKSGVTEGKDRVRDRDGTYVVDIDAVCGDSDDEIGMYKPYTAVAHATRYRLMSASTKRKLPSPCPSPIPGLGPDGGNRGQDGGQVRALVEAALTSNRHYLPYVKSPTTVSASMSRGRAGSSGEGSPITPRGPTKALSVLLGSEKEKVSRTMSSRVSTYAHRPLLC